MADAQSPAMPQGMVEVSKDEFFALLKADQRDIMPRCERQYTPWRVVNSRELWGWTSQGYVPDHSRGEVHAVMAAAARKLPATPPQGTAS